MLHVIDDPVTSLDHRWKDTIAKRLVAEAACRQVVAFTHDLHFLWMLNKHAEEMGAEIINHSIKRGDSDSKPGYVFLNNCPGLERDYKTTKIAREWLEKARNAEPQEQEHLLKQGFGALRSSYEAFVIHDLLQGVVTRWDERISLEGRLDRIQLSDHIVKTVVKKVSHLSQFIEGHLHSDTIQKPSVTALEEEVRAFESLRAEHKQLLRS